MIDRANFHENTGTNESIVCKLYIVKILEQGIRDQLLFEPVPNEQTEEESQVNWKCIHIIPSVIGTPPGQLPRRLYS